MMPPDSTTQTPKESENIVKKNNLPELTQTNQPPSMTNTNNENDNVPVASTTTATDTPATSTATLTNNNINTPNNKFAMPTNPTASLRRDLLLSNFDKTMTVEKAKFETNNNDLTAHDVSSNQSSKNNNDLSTIIASEDDNVGYNTFNEQHNITLPLMYALTSSPSAPTLSSSAPTSNNNNAALFEPLTTSQSANSGDYKSKNSSRLASTPIKREEEKKIYGNSNSYHPMPGFPVVMQQHKKSNQMNQTSRGASPAEVFHRNLVDAVSNVEDSDENEHYVYPYSGNEYANHEFPSLHRPLSVRSTPSSNSTPYSFDRCNNLPQYRTGECLKQTIYSKPVQEEHMPAEEEEAWAYNSTHRPKLRNAKEHGSPKGRSMDIVEGLRKNPGPWFDKNNYYHRFRNYSNLPQYGTRSVGAGGYTSDEEDAPLLVKRPHRRGIKISNSNNSRTSCQTTFWKWLGATCAIVFTFLFIITYQAKPLTATSVDIGRVLATDKELIFDLKVKAQNWNWWTIHVADADISVFAFSQIVPSSSSSTLAVNDTTAGVDPAEYLGTLKYLDEPLSIRSSRFNSATEETLTQIRIKSPGADLSGNERWSRMIRYPYGLVVRGVLKYKTMPLAMYPQSIVICNVTRVDPTTGTVSADPDKTICADQDELNTQAVNSVFFFSAAEK